MALQWFAVMNAVSLLVYDFGSRFFGLNLGANAISSSSSSHTYARPGIHIHVVYFCGVSSREDEQVVNVVTFKRAPSYGSEFCLSPSTLDAALVVRPVNKKQFLYFILAFC